MANPLLTDEQNRRLANQNSTYNQIMQGFEPVQQPQEDSWLGGLSRGAKAGFGGVGAGLLHAGQAAFGTDGSLAAGFDAMAKNNAQRREWDLADTLSLDYLTNPEGLAYGLGQLAGSMALPALFGAGVAAAVPTGGTSLLGTGALIGAAGAAPMAISEGGNTYAQGLQQGMTEDEAKKAGLTDAAIKLPFYMLSEGLSGKVAQGLISKGLLNAEGKSLGRRAAESGAKILGNAANEAYEEGTENRSSAYALGDQRISSLGNIFNPFDWNEEDKAQAVGVFTPTLALGALTGGAGHLRSRFDKTNSDVAEEIASEDGGTIEEAPEATVSGKEAFINAIAGQESGGNYNAENGDTGAYGKYQILPSNWPSWAEEAGIGADAPRTPENQEIVARFKLGQYYDKYGARGAAIAWYGGEGALNYSEEALNRKQGDNGEYPSINEYADEVLGRMGNVADSVRIDDTIDDTEENYFDESNYTDDTIPDSLNPVRGFDVSHLDKGTAQDRNSLLYGERVKKAKPAPASEEVASFNQILDNSNAQKAPNSLFVNSRRSWDAAERIYKARAKEQAERKARAQAIANIANAQQQSFLNVLRNRAAQQWDNAEQEYKDRKQDKLQSLANVINARAAQKWDAKEADNAQKAKAEQEKQAQLQNIARLLDARAAQQWDNAERDANLKQNQAQALANLLNAKAVGLYDVAQQVYADRAKEQAEKQRQQQAIANIINARAAQKFDEAETADKFKFVPQRQSMYDGAMRRNLAAMDKVKPEEQPIVEPTERNGRALDERNFREITLPKVREQHKWDKEYKEYHAERYGESALPQTQLLSTDRAARRNMPKPGIEARSFINDRAEKKSARERMQDAIAFVWKDDPKHPLKACRRQLNMFRDMRKEYLQPIYDVMAEGAGNGVSRIPIIEFDNQHRGRFYRQSNNSPWYAKYFKEHKKKPTQKAMYDIAEEVAFGENADVGYYAGVQGKELEAIVAENHAQLDPINDYIQTYESLELRLKENPNYGKEQAERINKAEEARRAEKRNAGETASAESIKTEAKHPAGSNQDEVKETAEPQEKPEPRDLLFTVKSNGKEEDNVIVVGIMKSKEPQYQQTIKKMLDAGWKKAETNTIPNVALDEYYAPATEENYNFAKGLTNKAVGYNLMGGQPGGWDYMQGLLDHEAEERRKADRTLGEILEDEGITADITVDDNQSITIEFSKKPSDEVRQSVKEAGYKWRDGAWKSKVNERSMEIAKELGYNPAEKTETEQGEKLNLPKGTTVDVSIVGDNSNIIQVKFNGAQGKGTGGIMGRAGYKWKSDKQLWQARKTEKALGVAEQLGYTEEETEQEIVERLKKHIGESWKVFGGSDESITDVVKVGDQYVYRTSKGVQLYRITDLQAGKSAELEQYKADEQQRISEEAEKQAKIDAENNAIKQEAQKKLDVLEGFASDKSDFARTRIANILNKKFNYEGYGVQTRADFVKLLLKDGYSPDIYDNEYYLSKGKLSQPITKTEYDFANYLLEKQGKGKIEPKVKAKPSADTFSKNPDALFNSEDKSQQTDKYKNYSKEDIKINKERLATMPDVDGILQPAAKKFAEFFKAHFPKSDYTYETVDFWNNYILEFEQLNKILKKYRQATQQGDLSAADAYFQQISASLDRLNNLFGKLVGKDKEEQQAQMRQEFRDSIIPFFDEYNKIVDKHNAKENAKKASKAKKQQNQGKQEYKYYLNARPADIGAVPKGFIRVDTEDNGGRYGAIYYDRQLSDKEVQQYELKSDADVEKEKQTPKKFMSFETVDGNGKRVFAAGAISTRKNRDGRTLPENEVDEDTYQLAKEYGGYKDGLVAGVAFKDKEARDNFVEDMNQLATNTAEETTDKLSKNNKTADKQEAKQQKSNYDYGDKKAILKDLLAATGLKEKNSKVEDVEGLDYSDAGLEEALNELAKECSKLSANPMFNPALYRAAAKVGLIFLKRTGRNFKRWAKALLDWFRKNRPEEEKKIKPFLGAIYKNIENWPKDLKFKEDIVELSCRLVGSSYAEGNTSFEAVYKDISEMAGEENAQALRGYLEQAYLAVDELENPTLTIDENVVESKQDKGGSQYDFNSTESLFSDDTGSRRAENEIRTTSSSEESSGSNGQGSRTLEGQSGRNGNNGVPGSRTAVGGKTSVREGSQEASSTDSDASGSTGLSNSVVDSLQEQPNVNEGAVKNIIKSASDRRVDATDEVTQKVNEVIKENDLDKRRADRLRKTAKVMPFLSKIQFSNTDFVADRLADNGKQGVMITDGTGTGKTFSGLAVAKEMVEDGKENILIVTPSDSVNNQWANAAKDFFGIELSKLDNIQDAGKGAVITTYANLGANDALIKRDWDLVICDESHYLMNNEQGEKTAALAKLRQLTLHPRELRARAEERILPEEKLEARRTIAQAAKLKRKKGQLKAGEEAIVEKAEKLQKEKADELSKEERAQVEAQVKDWEQLNATEKPKVMFMSATPFAYVPDIDYAEGYLFDYPKVEGGSYNQPGNGFQQFMIEHFGYHMRNNKLTKPDKAVDNAVMEVEFHEWLRKTGALTGHELEIDKDYNRGFLLVDQGVGKKIDEGFEFLRNNHDKYRELEGVLNKQFDSRRRNYLLESIKARESVPIIQQYLKAGKKVVVFYETNVERESFNPFKFTQQTKELLQSGENRWTSEEIQHEMDMFAKERPDLVNLNLDELSEPISIYREAFGDDAMFFNGRVSKNKRAEYVKAFNDDNSDKNLIFVQQDAGNAGISLHDTTGKHQRVLINIGIPRRPSYAIQIEGRIYRLGNKSNAIIRYLTTATNIENGLFAETVAGRASTAENLALGRRARGLRDSFKNAYQEIFDGTWEDRSPGTEGEDVGGKENDRNIVSTDSDYDRAKAFYFARGKKTAKNKAAEGVDYFATPEPVGYKMVQWAGLKDGDRVLEPSAGHGAISRFFSPNTENTIIEPSSRLAPQAQMNTENAKLINGMFEDLHISNKYDAITMNPPFGTGGKTAIEHLSKAFRHLREGGRVIALIPRGGMADKRFTKWYESDEAKNAHMVGEVLLPNVTFERAGTKVATRIVIIDKGGESQGVKRIDLSRINNINELFDNLESVEMPARPTKQTDAGTANFANSLRKGYAEGNSEVVTADSYKHTKTGEIIPSAKLNANLSYEEYRKVNSIADKNGGYYSRYAKAFLFQDNEIGRDKFVEEVNGANNTQYSVSSEAVQRAKEEVEAEIRAAFPNGKVEYVNGVPTITMPNGSKFQYSIRENIVVNAKEQRKADAAHGTSGARVQGFWKKFTGNGVQRMLAVSQNSERGTAFHEAMHAAIDLVLTEKEKNALYNYYEKKAKEQNRDVDEVIADAYRDWVLARQRKSGTMFGKLWRKVKDFCTRIKAIFDKGAEVERIMQDIESGRVYERGTNNHSAKAKISASAENIYSDTESINPNEDYIQGINDTDAAKVNTLAKSFEDKGFVGRPVVLVENGNEGYIAVTGSHRIEAAKQADVDLKAIVLENNEDTAQLIDARDDDERANIAKQLYEEGVISKSAYDVIREEADNNYTHYSVASSKHKIANAFTNTERKGVVDSAKDFFKEHRKSLYQDWFDKNNPLKGFDALTKATGGLSVYDQVQSLPATTAGMLKALTEGTAQHVKMANQHLKNVKMKYNVTLAMALEKIDKKQMDKAYPKYLAENGFDNWVNALGAYLGAERCLEMAQLARAEGKTYKFPKGLTEQECQEFVKKAPQQFKAAADIFYKVNDNVISIMEDAEVFSHDLAKTLRTKYRKYCPLLRDFSDTAAADSFIGGLTEGGRGIGNVSVPLKRINIEGSERGVLNPLETILKSYAVMLNRAERNKVALMAVENSRTADLHELIQEVPSTTADPKNCVFTVLINGKKKAYKTTQDLYGPIVGYNLPAANLAFGVARTAARMLRTGATMSPSFILRNVLRDTVFAGIASKNGFIPLVDTIRGAIALAKDPAMRAEFEAAGVTEYNFYSSQKSRIKSLDAMAGETPASAWEIIKAVFSRLEVTSDFFESSTRMGEYMKARQKGLSMEEAARAAREVTLDFSRSGRIGEQVNQVVPFFNACLQGGDKMVRLFREDFVGTSLKVLKYIVLPSLLLLAMNWDEDWYKDLDPDIKNNYWCLGRNIRIPKPQEAGVLFGSGIEALFQQAADKDKDAVSNFLKAFSSNMMPSVLPTLILPLIEWSANYSFFKGRPLVGNKYSRLPDELQYNDYTSELSKGIGSTFKISPMKIDNLVRGYTGTMGALLWSMAGEPFAKANNLPAKHFSELPFVRDFNVTDANLSRPMNEFYGILDKANRQHAGYGVKGKPEAAVKGIRSAGAMISKIRKDIDKITHSNLTPERKRELIDKRKEKMNQIAKQATARYGKYFE